MQPDFSTVLSNIRLIIFSRTRLGTPIAKLSGKTSDPEIRRSYEQHGITNQVLMNLSVFSISI